MAEQYKSDALAAVHEIARGLHEAGVTDERTMKAFDEMCLASGVRITAAVTEVNG